MKNVSSSFILIALVLYGLIPLKPDAQILVDPKASIQSNNSKSHLLPRQIQYGLLGISLSSTEVKQGHVFWVEVSGAELNPKTLGWTELDGIPTPLFQWQNAQGKKVLAGLVGVPFSKKPGLCDLRIHVKGEVYQQEVLAKIMVESADSNREAELLDLPENRVVPSSQEELKRLEQEDREIDAIFDIRSAERLWDQAIDLPFDGKYKISSKYGISRVYTSRVQRRIHWGVDYALPIGTPVRSSLAGNVVMAKEFGFMGKTVVIDHGIGLMTVYAHLKEINVQLGQQVKHRELIGKSGISGKSTGPLIHWKVVVSGVKVDPLSVVQLMREYR